ncbi:MAG: DUF4837 family protein [Flavobacteriaceae bacterium]|nr:DUF4837 family protein [Flavobacteriaceae bacterium]
MKRILTSAIAVALLLIITMSCDNSNNKAILARSTGQINHLIVVSNSTLWEGETGITFRKIMSEPIEGLPQHEVVLDVSPIRNNNFKNLFLHSRNILMFKKSNENSFKIVKDSFASPQMLIVVKGIDDSAISKVFADNSVEIISELRKADLKQMQMNNRKNSKDTIKTFKTMGIKMKVPRKFRFVDATEDFIWMRSQLYGGIAVGDGVANILVYTKPITDDLNIDIVIENRNEIGKKFIKGSGENMYMITEKAYDPYSYKTTIAGLQAIETRGKWEMKDDFMAGPFLNYTIVDKENNRLIVLEGFVYAPSIDKRDFMFELESIMKTFSLR